jgi:hypothetical protein
MLVNTDRGVDNAALQLWRIAHCMQPLPSVPLTQSDHRKEPQVEWHGSSAGILLDEVV